MRNPIKRCHFIGLYRPLYGLRPRGNTVTLVSHQRYDNLLGFNFEFVNPVFRHLKGCLGEVSILV
jgi:hypothetical protein